MNKDTLFLLFLAVFVVGITMYLFGWSLVGLLLVAVGGVGMAVNSTFFSTFDLSNILTILTP